VARAEGLPTLTGVTSRWNAEPGVPRGDDYDDHFSRLAASGKDMHGEVAFVQRFEPTRVLDAGCGTGRVAIELANRGVEVVGVDLDETMLGAARRKAPAIAWHHRDLVDLDLGDERFDVVVAAGNVMIFVAPNTEATVVGRLAAHLAPGGVLICGFSLRPGGYGVADHDADAAAAGLELVAHHATWDGDELVAGGDYVVAVHRRPAGDERD
jgi:SAM-dependent methyltransferase